MTGYVRGSRAHLNQLVERITESCNNIKNRSTENEADVQRIIEDLTCIYLDYASRWATMSEQKIKEIDIPEFMK